MQEDSVLALDSLGFALEFFNIIDVIKLHN